MYTEGMMDWQESIILICAQNRICWAKMHNSDWRARRWTLIGCSCVRYVFQTFHLCDRVASGCRKRKRKVFRFYKNQYLCTYGGNQTDAYNSERSLGYVDRLNYCTMDKAVVQIFLYLCRWNYLWKYSMQDGLNLFCCQSTIENVMRSMILQWNISPVTNDEIKQLQLLHHPLMKLNI